jgi:hypothetical protein
MVRTQVPRQKHRTGGRRMGWASYPGSLELRTPEQAGKRDDSKEAQGTRGGLGEVIAPAIRRFLSSVCDM